MTRAGATTATTMPATVSADKDLGVVDCELAELELDDILSAVIVMVATGEFAGVPKAVTLGKVESEVEVEVDEGACQSKSAFTIESTRNVISTYHLQRHGLQQIRRRRRYIRRVTHINRKGPMTPILSSGHHRNRYILTTDTHYLRTP